MLTKTDCMSILVKLEEKGIDINSYMKQLIISKDIPQEVLKFITQNQGIELSNFYELLRKNHNRKKSPLYINILKEHEDRNEIILTLSCLLTQIILYGNKLSTGKEIFLKEARAEEISRVLNLYFKDNNLEPCLSVLKLIKTDLMVLEYFNGRRN